MEIGEFFNNDLFLHLSCSYGQIVTTVLLIYCQDSYYLFPTVHNCQDSSTHLPQRKVAKGTSCLAPVAHIGSTSSWIKISRELLFKEVSTAGVASIRCKVQGKRILNELLSE